MQHLDLTATGIDMETIEELARALNSANTLVSIHFSGAIEIKQIIQRVLGSLI